MFFKQTTKDNRETLEPIETISCAKCMALVLKGDSVCVKSDMGDIHYCLVHRPAYSRKELTFSVVGPWAKYFKEVECDEDGKVIISKKKKIAGKKK